MKKPLTPAERRDYLKRRMAELGYSCARLAPLLDRHVNTIRNYVAGRTIIHTSVVEKVRSLKRPRSTA